MNPRVGLGLALWLWGCGGDPAPIAQLTLAESYDVVGVARLFPDGLTFAGHRSFAFSLQGVRSSGGRAVAEGRAAGGPVALMGTFDAAEGELVLGPADGVLTSTRAERVVTLGGRADDALPKDGVAQELVGFVNSTFGASTSEGRFVATARYDGRPAEPDLTKITLETSGLGKWRLKGTVGAVPTAAGLEILRHEIDRGPPVQVAFQSLNDGSFDQEIDALSGELLVILARSAGRASRPVLLAVP